VLEQQPTFARDVGHLGLEQRPAEGEDRGLILVVQSMKNRLARWLAGAALGIAGCAQPGELAQSESAADEAGRMLPDIIVRRSDLYDHSVGDSAGRRYLYLSNGTANVGEGKLHLYGGPANLDGTQDVIQRISHVDGTTSDRLAGKFTYHPTHGHIHFEGWAAYRLRSILADDGVGPIVAAGEKTSFCILDLAVHDSTLPNYNPAGEFRACGSGTQGISVGWIDIYSQYLPGQSIDITGLADGDYWLESEVDPDDNVLESNEDNNIERIKVAIGSPPDAYEPNDSLADLAWRPIGAPNSPNLGPVDPLRIIEGLTIDRSGNDDWFRFYANSTGSAADYVRIEHPGSDLDLDLLDSSGGFIATSSMAGDDDELSLAGLPEDSYYVRVHGRNGATTPGYRLLIDPPANSPPTVTIAAPGAGDVRLVASVDTYRVEWSVIDPEADDTWVTVMVNGQPQLDGQQIVLPTSRNTPGSQGFYVINSADFVAGTYWVYVQVTDGGTTTGAWSLGTVTWAIEVPANDLCANASPIGDGLTIFSTVGAMTDGPEHALCNAAGSAQVKNDIWFEYTATCDTQITFSTCMSAPFDTKIAVYDGTSCADLASEITACVDDTPMCSLTSSVTVGAIQGQALLVRLGGYGSTTGRGTLQITASPACPICGNGVIEDGELCDGAAGAPANQVCNATCTSLELVRPLINEVFYNSPSYDVGSFIEIAGPPNMPLDGYRLRFLRSVGTEYFASQPLDGRRIGPSGYFLLVQDSLVTVPAGATSMTSGKANLINNVGSLQLWNGSALVDAIGYGSFPPGASFGGEGTPAADTGGASIQSLARRGGFVDRDDNAMDFVLSTQTPGAANP
jgi:hypothetical protein